MILYSGIMILKGGDDMDDKLLTIREYAVLMGVKPVTVQRWIKKGELKVIRKGRTVRISSNELKVKESE